MNFIAKGTSYLKQQFSEHTKASDYNILAVGMIGAIGHPVYWLWWTYVDPLPNENLLMRAIGMFSCILLLLRRFWPISIVRFLPVYYFLTVAYTLPFFFTYYLLSSNYSMLWSMAEVAMLFFSIIILPSFVVWALNLSLGIGFAVLMASFFIPELVYVNVHSFLYIYFPVFIFCVGGGVTFSYSNIKGIAAQARNKTLQALAGSIAHEIRNPLGQIKASLNGIERALPVPAIAYQTQTLSAQQLKNLYEYVAIGESAIKRGSQIISMILDEVKSKSIDTTHFNYLQAAQATQKAIDEYGYETEGERHKISMRVVRNFMFKGDETLYLFVIFNLIKNALYYFKLDPAARIIITINQPRVIIKDTGPGIPEDYLPYLFNSFQTYGKQGGTGLGLAYCKRVMQAFGGDINCHSIVGVYTEFTLRFPEVPYSTWEAYEENIIKRARVLLTGKRILIVDDDDDETLALVTQDILVNLGINVDRVENGEVALHKLMQVSYDLVIMDLNMPILDGYVTAEKIRLGAVPGCENIPIVAYTTESAYMAKVKTKKVGINDFISKPCEPLILVQTLEQVLSQAISMGASISEEIQTSLLYKLTGRTILVADDSESNRQIIRYDLEDWGINVLEAENGIAVINQLELNPNCDAILMDIHMPGMNGLETTHMIRTKEAVYRTIPIIALTGDSGEINIEIAYSSGINDYIVKPVESTMLYQKLIEQFNVVTKPFDTISTNTFVSHTPSWEDMEIERKMDYASLFNMERLEKFHKRGLLEKCILSFRRQTTEYLDVLAMSAKNKDFSKMEDALHFLQGSSMTIGAQAFGEYTAKIYKEVLNGQWPSEEGWLEKITVLHTQTLTALEMYRKETL